MPLSAITTITGESDKGKSAIIRALIFVLTNQPPDTNWVRHGAKFAKVILTVDGHKVIRGWSKDRGHYYQFDGETFSAVGRGPVPDKIAGFLNTSEINIQSQHDRHFLLGVSAGECGRIINRCAGLEIIDRGLSNIGQKVNAATRIFNDRESTLREKKSSLLSTKWAVEGAKILSVIKGHQREVKRLLAKEDSVESLLFDMERNIANLKKHKTRFRQIDPLTDLAKSMDGANARTTTLKNLLDPLEEAERDIVEATNRLMAINKKIKMVKVCPLCGGKI